mgnify:CR=1 FL=1
MARRAEGRPRYQGHPGLGDQVFGQGGIVIDAGHGIDGGLHRREGIEGAGTRYAAETLDAIQRIDELVVALFEVGQHLSDTFLGALESRLSCHLGDGGWIGGALGLDLLDNVLIPNDGLKFNAFLELSYKNAGSGFDYMRFSSSFDYYNTLLNLYGRKQF